MPIKGTDDRDVCVFEVNTTPGLRSDTTARAYRDAILNYIREIGE